MSRQSHGVKDTSSCCVSLNSCAGARRSANSNATVENRRPPGLVPYIYTRQEIARLLASTSSCQQGHNCMIRAETFHTLLLMLYATGARLGEVVGLRSGDVNFKTGMLSIKGAGLKAGRVIPLNRELLEQLQSYLNWRAREDIGGEHLFTNENGGPISTSTARHNFNRLCRVSEINLRYGAPARPRLHDLRQTFAVHRITSWIRDGADLNRLLPALAAYMGQVGLGSTDKYLLLTPERFRNFEASRTVCSRLCICTVLPPRNSPILDSV